MLKPLEYNMFEQKMTRVLNNIKKEKKEKEEYLSIKLDGGYKKINQQDILYIEVDGHYTIIHTNNEEIKQYSTFKTIVDKLDSKIFARCNRCYMINLKYVKMIKDNLVYVNNEKLLISRNQKKSFLESFSSFLGDTL
jgi:DNA-binding LytR/AlgR family response regulator